MPAAKKEGNDVTITITVVNDGSDRRIDLKTEPKDAIEPGMRVNAWKPFKVIWQADASVTCDWVVGMKNKAATPFKDKRWLFSGASNAQDDGDISRGDGKEFEFWVMVFLGKNEGLNEMIYADPILVIRNSSRSAEEFAANVIDRANEIAEDAEELIGLARSFLYDFEGEEPEGSPPDEGETPP